MRSLVRVFLVGVLAVTSAAGADENDPRLSSRVTLDLGRSSSDTQRAGLDADVGLSNLGRLQLGIGRSRFKNSTSELQTTSFRAGYQSDPLEEWSFGGSFENWGTRDKLTTNTLRGLAVWSPSDWEFGLEPEVKTIQWTVVNRNRRIQASGSGLTVRVGYYGVKSLSLGISASGYQYSERMDTILESGYFYDEALDLAAGFPKSVVGANAGYRVDWFSFGLNASVVRYQFVEENSRSASLRLSADLSKSWGVSIEGGQSRSDTSTTNFSSIAFSYLW